MSGCLTCKLHFKTNHELAQHILGEKEKHAESEQKWAAKFLANEGKTWRQIAAENKRIGYSK